MSTEPLFSIRAVSREGACLLRLSGEMDMAAVPIFEQELAALDHSQTSLLIDLSGLKFVDSSGLKCLIELSKDGASAGRTIEMISAGRQLSGLLALTGTQFLVTPTEESTLYKRFLDAEAGFSA
jgi:anti-sigma B factor antagonist